MTINSQKKNWDLLKNCQKHALKLSWKSCFWHALVDQTFCGQKTNLHEQSPTGRELVTNAWLVWFLLFITQVNLSNIVMWETLHNVSHTAASCPTAPSSSASSRPVTARFESHSTQSAGKPAAGGSNQNDAASSSQVWLTDAKMSERAKKTRCCRNEPGSEFSRTCKETCRRKFRHQRRGRLEVAAQLPHISC